MVLFEPGPVCGYTKPSGLRCVVIENMVALYLRKESTNLAEFSADMTDILDSLIQCSKKKCLISHKNIGCSALSTIPLLSGVFSVPPVQKAQAFDLCR